MQTIVINGRKLAIRKTFMLMGEHQSQELVQLGSGAWMWGKAIPHCYVKDMKELEGFEVPAAIKQEVSDWIEACRNAPPVPVGRLGEAEESSVKSEMGKILDRLDPAEQQQIVELLKSHLHQKEDSRQQPTRVNSHEGYGQGMDIPVYEERNPRTGHLEYKNPLGKADLDNCLHAEEQAAAFAQYNRAMDKQEVAGDPDVVKPQLVAAGMLEDGGIEAELQES